MWVFEMFPQDLISRWVEHHIVRGSFAWVVASFRSQWSLFPISLGWPLCLVPLVFLSLF